MPITYAPEPPDAADRLRASLARIGSRPSPPRALGGAAADTFEFGAPHRVFDISAEDLASSAGLERAHQSGVRYLVRTQGTAVAAAEIQAGESAGEPSRVSNVNFGQFAGASADAIAKVSTEVGSGPAAYELRLLRCSAIYLIALWLKASRSGDDLVVPIAPAPEPLAAERIYAVDDFLRLVRPLARRLQERRRNGKFP